MNEAHVNRSAWWDRDWWWDARRARLLHRYPEMRQTEAQRAAIQEIFATQRAQFRRQREEWDRFDVIEKAGGYAGGFLMWFGFKLAFFLWVFSDGSPPMWAWAWLLITPTMFACIGTCDVLLLMRRQRRELLERESQ